MSAPSLVFTLEEALREVMYTTPHRIYPLAQEGGAWRTCHVAENGDTEITDHETWVEAAEHALGQEIIPYCNCGYSIVDLDIPTRHRYARMHKLLTKFLAATDALIDDAEAAGIEVPEWP